MNTITESINSVRYRKHSRPLSRIPELFGLHRALTRAARAVGERMRTGTQGSWEFPSQGGDHLWSRNDLEATGFCLRYVADFFARENLKLLPTLENEEVPLVPLRSKGRAAEKVVRLVIDPIDGSKAFDNWKCAADCPIPAPGSAVSIAAVCPVLEEVVSSAVYCFDLGEVFSAVYLGVDEQGEPQYASFRNGALMEPIIEVMKRQTPIEAKRRVLNCTYNSRALAEIARLDLALMERGLKAGYGGLTGSTATDIINVVRGSFAACVDIRALCAAGGSVPYWYDAAGALPIARGRGLRVITTDRAGLPLCGGNHPIRMPLAMMVARPDATDKVIDAIRRVILPSFFAPGTPAAQLASA